MCRHQRRIKMRVIHAVFPLQKILFEYIIGIERIHQFSRARRPLNLSVQHHPTYPLQIIRNSV